MPSTSRSRVLRDGRRADHQVPEPAWGSGAAEHRGSPLVDAGPWRRGRWDHRRRGGRCGCGFGHSEDKFDAAGRIDDAQLSVGELGHGATVGEPACRRVEVLGSTAAELDPDEPAEVALIDEDPRPTVAPGETGHGVPGEPELAVEGGQTLGVGDGGGEAQQSVEGHQWVPPSGPVQRLRSSPMPSTVVTISSPGARNRPRAMPTPSGRPGEDQVAGGEQADGRGRRPGSARRRSAVRWKTPGPPRPTPRSAARCRRGLRRRRRRRRRAGRAVGAKLFPRQNCGGEPVSCTSRSEMSWPAVSPPRPPRPHLRDVAALRPMTTTTQPRSRRRRPTAGRRRSARPGSWGTW